MTPRAFLVGLGPIGVEIGNALAARGVAIAGGADPLFAGRPLSGSSIHARAADLYASTERRPGDVCVLCTGSRVPSVAPQIEEALAAGLHVVSTCEELAYPALRHPEIAARLDAEARGRGLTVAGTGVNPGLVMDRLPLTLAQACARVERVRVERVVDAARRRGPLRAKVGAGLTPEAFRDGVAAGRLGHVGLAESAALLALGLGFAGDRVDETLEPVLDAAGVVLGVLQTATAAGGRVSLRLQMSVDAPNPHDRIVLEGDPPLDVTIAGGTHGDRATVGTVVNLVAGIGGLGRGLVTAATSYR